MIVQGSQGRVLIHRIGGSDYFGPPIRDGQALSPHPLPDINYALPGIYYAPPDINYASYLLDLMCDVIIFHLTVY